MQNLSRPRNNRPNLARRLRQVSLAMIAFGGCSAFAPSEPDLPAGAIPLTAQPAYAAWFERTEACSGLGGQFKQIQWFVVPGAETFATKMWFNTIGANPVAAATARAVLRVIDDDGILKNCKQQGDLFRTRIGKLCQQYPQALKEIRGSGLFQGLEIAGTTLEQSQVDARPLSLSFSFVLSLSLWRLLLSFAHHVVARARRRTPTRCIVGC